jgi:FAD-linked oxidoreductase
MKIVGGKWSNWSGNISFKPRTVIAPKDEVDLAASVRMAEGRVRFPGSGHSFSPVDQTDGTLIDLSAFGGLKGFDPDREVASIGGAQPLWGLGSLLHPLGYALDNMGDTDRQTLAGAVATGTHGTGLHYGSFSAAVASFRLLTTTGQVLHCAPDENAEIFAGGRLALGLFGVMTEIDMKVRPIYKLQRRYFQSSARDILRKLDGLVAANRHFEFFWFPHSETVVCKSLNESDAHAPTRHSARTLYARGEIRRPKEYLFAGGSELLRVMPGLAIPAHKLFAAVMGRKQKVRWSHEVFPTPRTVKFNGMEYAVPYEKGAEALQEVVEVIRKKKLTTAFPIAFRTVKADDVWLSPFYGRDSATIAVHQYAKVDAKPLFSVCEAILKSYGGRPHWGQYHTMSRAEAELNYPKLGDFIALRKKLDPKDKFLNEYLAKYFG